MRIMKPCAHNDTELQVKRRSHPKLNVWLSCLLLIGNPRGGQSITTTHRHRHRQSLPKSNCHAIQNPKCKIATKRSQQLYSQAAYDATNNNDDHYPTAQQDWKSYALRRNYERAGGILYKQSVLAPHEYAAIMSELRSLNLKMVDEKESSFATNRVGALISKKSSSFERICDVLSCEEGSLYRLVNNLGEGNGDKMIIEKNADDLGQMVLAPDIPIEVREYEKTGAGMEWHIDDVLYRPEQIEVVLTLENSSDCWTMWRPHDRPLPNSKKDQKVTNYDIQSAQTTPNSALILKAGGVEHKVSPLTMGKRSILKMAFVREGASLEKGMEVHASQQHDRTKKLQKNKNGKGRAKNGVKKKKSRQKR